MFLMNATLTSTAASFAASAVSLAGSGLAAVTQVSLTPSDLAGDSPRLTLEAPTFRTGLFDGRWASFFSKLALGLALGTTACGDDNETVNPAPVGACLPEEEAEKLDGGIAGLKNDAGGDVWICPPPDEIPYDPGPGCDEGGCPTDTPPTQ